MFTCVFSELRGEMIVHFVDIGGIDDHQQFKLSFHNTLLYTMTYRLKDPSIISKFGT
jgi:hypothetical protein